MLSSNSFERGSLGKMGAYPKRTATPPKAYSGVPKTPGPKRVGSHPSRHVHKDQQHRSDHQRLWKRETFLKGRDENKLSRWVVKSQSKWICETGQLGSEQQAGPQKRAPEDYSLPSTFREGECHR
ncbi:uncharacterized protein LOC142584898 isoform X1 [Dermacentor variabilis]|uniref:uncharacterized protein LOC142584898 isoform X1 n=1 Tax=Dermacentor variabilis TaxID=34621 RepID=UPI003F5BE5F7